MNRREFAGAILALIASGEIKVQIPYGTNDLLPQRNGADWTLERMRGARSPLVVAGDSLWSESEMVRTAEGEYVADKRSFVVVLSEGISAQQTDGVHPRPFSSPVFAEFVAIECPQLDY